MGSSDLQPLNDIVKKPNERIISPKTRNALGRRGKDDLLGAIIVEEKTTLLSRIIFIGLCVLQFFALASFGAVDTWAFGILFSGIALLFVMWLLDGAISGALKYEKNSLYFPIIGLIFIGLIQLLPLRSPGIPADLLNTSISATLSLDGYATRFFVLHLIVFLIFFFLISAYLNNQYRLRSLTNFIIFLCFGAAVIGILQRLRGNKIYWIREVYMAQPFGMFVNSHHFAALMEMSIALALGLIFVRSVEREKLFLYLFAAFVSGIALLMTGSRGGVIGIFGVITFLVVARYVSGGFAEKDREVLDDEFNERSSNFERRLLLGGGISALILLICGAAFLLPADNVLTRSVTLAKSGDFSTGRLHFWSVAWEIIKNNPILGVGFDAFGVAYTKYDSWNGTMRVERAHNDYLQLLTDAGILGLVCGISFIVMLFRQGFRNLSQSIDPFRRGVILGALAGCFGILLHSFFDFPLRTSANALIFLSLAAIATTSIAMPRIIKQN